MAGTVLLEQSDGVACVTLNRPGVLNALNLEMRDDLWSTLDALEADDDVQVIVFRGAGRAFCSGADISEFGTAPSFVEARRARLERDLWGRLARFEKPMVAAIHGYALGAGCELSLLCDFRIAAEDAMLGLPETHLGYMPTAGGSQTLPRTTGRGRAFDMLLSAEAIPAARALDYGILHAVVARDSLAIETERLARRLGAQPATALRLAKRALFDGRDQPLSAALRLEAALRRRLVST
jgi:enoyl-CoA hydratase/carnithine racemase